MSVGFSTSIMCYGTHTHSYSNCSPKGNVEFKSFKSPHTITYKVNHHTEEPVIVYTMGETVGW